jgi:outer membrane immunogenic protein
MTQKRTFSTALPQSNTGRKSAVCPYGYPRIAILRAIIVGWGFPMSNRAISILSGAAFILAASGSAFAADMAVKAPPPAPVLTPVSMWAGWYVGLNAGGGWGNNSGINNSITSSFCNPNIGGCPGAGAFPGFGAATAQAVTASFDTKLRGFIGGGQIGYNWQDGVTVWGLEADFQGADLKGSASAANTTVPDVNTPIEFVTVAGTGSQKLEFLGTLRGRLGWAPSGPWLVYVTGGLAYGHTETSASFAETAGFPNVIFNANSAASINAWQAGWTVGGGFEWMIAPRWSIKGEYLYYDLGTVTVNNAINVNTGPVPFFGVTIASEAAYRGSIARAGINYHF